MQQVLIISTKFYIICIACSADRIDSQVSVKHFCPDQKGSDVFMFRRDIGDTKFEAVAWVHVTWCAWLSKPVSDPKLLTSPPPQHDDADHSLVSLQVTEIKSLSAPVHKAYTSFDCRKTPYPDRHYADPEAGCTVRKYFRVCCTDGLQPQICCCGLVCTASFSTNQTSADYELVLRPGFVWEPTGRTGVLSD